MEEKICSKCKKSLPLSEFSKRVRSKDGLQNSCRDCSNKNNADYYQENRLARKAKLCKNRQDAQKLARNLIMERLSVGCVDCPEKDLVVLDFDHLGDKKYSISEMVHGGYSIDSISKEIDKCEVRCANCHRRKTAKDFNWYRLYVNKEE